MVGNFIIEDIDRQLTAFPVMGYQYTILAHMLLIIYDSKIPKAGPAHKEAVRKVDVRLPDLKSELHTKVLIGASKERRTNIVWNKPVKYAHAFSNSYCCHGYIPL